MSEDDQSILSDNSDASGFSSFSKLSLQSSRLRQQRRQHPGGVDVILSRHGLPTKTVTRSSTGDQRSAAPTTVHVPASAVEGEVFEDNDPPLQAARGEGSSRRQVIHEDHQKSSSTEEKSVTSSLVVAAPKIREAVSTTIATGTTVTPSSGTQAAHKRASGIGHRFSNVLGISKKNANPNGTGKFLIFLLQISVRN